MTSNRSLIRLALKKGIKSDFRIIDFVTMHDECRNTRASVTDSLNKMIENEEVKFNDVTKELKLQGYPIIKFEEKQFVNDPR